MMAVLKINGIGRYGLFSFKVRKEKERRKEECTNNVREKERKKKESK
jgi:hypothetical protein